MARGYTLERIAIWDIFVLQKINEDLAIFTIKQKANMEMAHILMKINKDLFDITHTVILVTQNFLKERPIKG